MHIYSYVKYHVVNIYSSKDMNYIYIYIYVCVCACVCMCVCVYVCVYTPSLNTYASSTFWFVCMSLCLRVYVCMC